jgi:peptide/nickel transport system substrate-binding protein
MDRYWRTLSRRQFVQGVGATSLALVAACAPSQQAAPPEAPGTGPASAPPQTTSGGTSEWVVAIAEEPAALDPLTGTSAVASIVAQMHIFDPLVSFHGPSFKLAPMVAESWKVVDDRTWDFTLRKGVQFHNGDALTANDVKYSLDLYKADTGGRQVYAADVVGVEPLDQYTVRLTTTGPNPGLLANLAQLPVLPRETRERIGQEAFDRQPVGTGPYRLVEFVRGQRLALEANPGYWGGQVTPTKLTLRPVADPTTRVAELKSGGVQIIAAPPIGQLKDLDSGDTGLLPVKGARTMMHQFNSTTPPFDDVRVRQAVNYAVDRAAILNQVLEGHGELLHGPFVSAWLGYDPALQPYPYDPARARQLLTEAGYPNGFETVFNHSSGVFLKDREIAEVVASQLGQVGIRVQLVPTERAKLQEDWLNGTFRGITATAWGAAADPDPMIGWAFYKRKGYKPDAQIDGLIEQSRRTVDPEQRKRVLQEFSRYAHEQAYWLFLHAQDEFYASRKGIPWVPTPNGQSFANISYFLVAGR